MTGPAARRRWPLAAALAVTALLGLICFSSIQVRSDLAALLPEGESQASRLMMQQLRTGTASNLMLIGIDGAPPHRLAVISDAMAQRLRQSKLFRMVNNGQQLLSDDAMEALFRYRYLLSPTLSAQDFDVARLKDDFSALRRGLDSSASPLVQQLGMPDPTGAFRAMATAMQGGNSVRTIDGVWFAPGRDRALMLVQTVANGLDYTAGGAALAAVQESFRATGADAHLVVSGPAIFAHDAAQSIRADVRLLSIVSSLLVAALLFWRFRSLWVVAVIAIPLLLGAAAGALAVQLCFGFVHGITLGFGMTMLGVTVDYPVLLIGHRKRAEAAYGTLQRIGHAFNLAVLTASLGLTGMVFAGLPGLSQLGVFSVAGILTAAGITGFVLPPLIVAADLAPVSAGDPARLARIEQARRWRLPCAALAGAALLSFAVKRPVWDADLAHLSPVPAAALAADAELRADIGAPESGQVLIVRGQTAEAVLQREEEFASRIDALVHDHVIGGADWAAQFLPSVQMQGARQGKLPDDATLAARIAAAADGLGFSASAFSQFRNDVSTSRSILPLSPGHLPAPLATDALLSARLNGLLFADDAGWVGIVAPRAIRDPAALEAAFTGILGVTYVDIHQETNGLAAGYTRRALPWLAGGAAAALIVLWVGLRDTARLMRVTGSIGAALAVTIAALTLSGVRFSVVHVVALQFVAGIGLDYALFFSRTGLDVEERSRTLRTLLTCNAMALLTFGLLCVCRTPLLRDIGTTVATGVVCAMIFAFMFAGRKPALSAGLTA